MSNNEIFSGASRVLSALFPLLCLVTFVHICRSDMQNDPSFWKGRSGDIGLWVFMPLMLVATTWVFTVYRYEAKLLSVLMHMTLLIWGFIAIASVFLKMAATF